MINKFSKMLRVDKINWLKKELSLTQKDSFFDEFTLSRVEDQHRIESISENVISNYHLPYSIAPNFLINQKEYVIPLVIEESSVVAALSSSAKFWAQRGGVKAKVINKIKKGHVHFISESPYIRLQEYLEQNESLIRSSLHIYEQSMKQRGGGLTSMKLKDHNDFIPGYYTIEIEVNTCDAMGANYINTLLEKIGFEISKNSQIEVIMSILSNNTPDCLVEASVSCHIDQLDIGRYSGREFARRFDLAVKMAEVNKDRAVTHNKGILNGVDAVAIATGNDFRAIEASIHSYACSNGDYRGLSRSVIEDDHLKFSLKLPLCVGTVGGLTKLHPLAQKSLQILGNPDSTELMEIMASVGLLQNFAALKTLTTVGIQSGHMKMHLNNILMMVNAKPREILKAEKYFSDKVISVSAVRSFIERVRIESRAS